MLTRDIEREAEAARALVANIRDAIGDDEDLKLDMIEGQTNLKEVLEAAAQRIAFIDASTDAIKAMKASLDARVTRFERQKDVLRTAVCAAMAQAELAKVELATATLTRKAVPPKAIVEREADIPGEFWKRADPKLDLRELLKALKNGPVPGATLSNGGETVQVRFV